MSLIRSPTSVCYKYGTVDKRGLVRCQKKYNFGYLIRSAFPHISDITFRNFGLNVSPIINGFVMSRF